jgi:hypothetical protein
MRVGLYDARFKKPIDELDVSDSTREMLWQGTTFEPLPFVERAVFIATPHRGSYLTLNRVAQWAVGFELLHQHDERGSSLGT